jgi:xylan 1,4-beta-xylosidase
MAASPSPAPGQDAGPAHARFEWFEYAGRDTVYATLQAGENRYVNPVIKGFHPDPSIVRVGKDFYLVTSSFGFFPGVPLFHSRDLVSWTQVGHVLDRPSQLNLDGLEISEGVFAPAIRFHDGVFYMLTTLVGAGGNFLVTAADPAGPWSDPVWLPEVDGIDPSIFFDDDGRIYILNNGPTVGEPLYEGHRAIWIQEYDAEAGQTIGPRTMIVDGGVDITTEPIWIEAPHLFKVDEQYYLIAAEGGTGYDHSEVVFRSASAEGPYVPFRGNPILTQRHLRPDRAHPVTSTGHADFVQLESGEWWTVFLGTRPYDGDYYNTGRETFLLPVRWVDGWPIILQGEDAIPLSHPRPALAPQPPPPVPTSGNFVHRDRFADERLSPYWTFIRTPREQWYSTGSDGLRIEARPVAIGDRGQPSFIGRRQQHLHASASAAMHFVPLHDGDEAGLVAFHNDDHYYFLGLARVGGQQIVKVEMRARNAGVPEPLLVASAPVSREMSGPVFLKIEAEGDRYSFFFAVEPDDWQPVLEGADGKVLSTRVAGGFVGTMLGMYAHRVQ